MKLQTGGLPPCHHSCHLTAFITRRRWSAVALALILVNWIKDVLLKTVLSNFPSVTGDPVRTVPASFLAAAKKNSESLLPSLRRVKYVALFSEPEQPTVPVAPQKKCLGHWLSHFPVGLKVKVSTPRKPWGSFLGDFCQNQRITILAWLNQIASK